MPVAGPALVAEDLVVKSTAARIPEVLLGAELQPVQVAAQVEALGRTFDDLGEAILIVHQVIEGKMRIDPWCRQDLEEGLMAVVTRIVVAAAIEITTTQPGRGRDPEQLISTFNSS